MPILPRTISHVNQFSSINDITRGIKSLRSLGSYADAEKLCNQAIAVHPKNAELFLLLASVMLAAGRKNEAVRPAEQAYLLEPNSFHQQLFVARLFLETYLFEMAYAHLKDMETKRPHSYLVNWFGADYYETVGKGQLALPYYEKAVEDCDDPDNLAMLKLARATCLVNIGEMQAAKPELLELLDIEKIGDRALQYLVFAARGEELQALLPRVEVQLSKCEPDSQLRADWLIALGRICEGQKNYDAAFANWQESRRISNIKAPAYDKKTMKKPIKFHAAFSAEAFRRVATYGHPSDLLVSIGGMPRSGTTLTEQIVAAHPQCIGVGEIGRMNMTAGAIMRQYNDGDPIANLVQNAKQGELTKRGDDIIKMLELIAGPGHRHVVDKTPENWSAFGCIHLVFPNAKMIHCRRHPADCFISAYQNLFGNLHTWVNKQTSFVDVYLKQEKGVAHWLNLFPKNIHEMQYEKLVGDPDGEVRKLLEFLDLPWDDQCLRFFEQKKTVRTFSGVQVRNSIYTSSVARWKNYEKHLGPLFEALDVANFNYPMP